MLFRPQLGIWDNAWMTAQLTLTRPDDWHLHVRDGDALNTVVPHTAAQFGRAVIMPNLRPPVTTAAPATSTATVTSRSMSAVPCESARTLPADIVRRDPQFSSSC